MSICRSAFLKREKRCETNVQRKKKRKYWANEDQKKKARETSGKERNGSRGGEKRARL